MLSIEKTVHSSVLPKFASSAIDALQRNFYFNPQQTYPVHGNDQIRTNSEFTRYSYSYTHAHTRDAHLLLLARSFPSSVMGVQGKVCYVLWIRMSMGILHPGLFLIFLVSIKTTFIRILPTTFVINHSASYVHSFAVSRAKHSRSYSRATWPRSFVRKESRRSTTARAGDE